MTLRSCSPRLEKRSLFSPPAPCAKRMARGFRCLRAAIRAARPHLANIFEKLLDQKTFYFACGSFFHPFCIRKAFYSNAAFHVKHFSFLFLENHSKNRKSLPILQHFVEFPKIFSDFYEIALQNFTISCKIVKQCPLLSGHKYIFLETNRQKSTGEEAANA